MSTLSPRNKRIFLLSDGTWQTVSQEIPTNVSKLPNLIAPVTSSNNQQLVRYEPGVGVSDSPLLLINGGAWGMGLEEDIKDLYLFLVNNYVPGDHVFIIGYSRGAYTARSLAGLLHFVGLLHSEHRKRLDEAFEQYRNRREPLENYLEFKEAYTQHVPIKCLACFDTVGSMGIPVDLPFPLNRFAGIDKYRFHDTTLNPDIEHAIHILSVDEERKRFKPTLMVPHPSRGSEQLTQLYFPGGHGGVGGGQKGEESFAANTLRFLVEEISRRCPGVEWNRDQIPEEDDINLLDEMRSSASLSYRLLMWYGGSGGRRVNDIAECHESVLRRFAKVKSWRPKCLRDIESALHAAVKKAGWL